MIQPISFSGWSVLFSEDEFHIFFDGLLAFLFWNESPASDHLRITDVSRGEGLVGKDVVVDDVADLWKFLDNELFDLAGIDACTQLDDVAATVGTIGGHGYVVGSLDVKG